MNKLEPKQKLHVARNSGDTELHARTLEDLLNKLRCSYVRRKKLHRSPMNDLVLRELANGIASLLVKVSQNTGLTREDTSEKHEAVA